MDANLKNSLAQLESIERKRKTIQHLIDNVFEADRLLGKGVLDKDVVKEALVRLSSIENSIRSDEIISRYMRTQ